MGDAPIAALIFDMDGLLVDSEDLAAGALAQFLQNHGVVMVEGTMEQTLGRRLPEAIEIVAEYYELPGDRAQLTAEYEQLRLEAIRGRVTPMEGAAEILAWGREAGLRIALATSSLRTHALESLAHTGLLGLFDAEVTGELVTKGKPDPQMFLRAAEVLDVPPANAVVLEDAPAGLQAAFAAGMRSIWVPNQRTQSLDPKTTVTYRASSLIAAKTWLATQSLTT